jgi:hypothetical protein
MATKRISKMVNDFSNMEYTRKNGVLIIASAADYHEEDCRYILSYYPSDRMPSFKTEKFQTVDELAAKMKEISGDLRVWRKSISEES